MKKNKILEAFTLRSIILNKKRSILTIIGIILSTALIVSTATLGTSFYKTMLETTYALVGKYHMIYEDVSNEDSKYITKNVNIEEYFTINNLGYAKLEGGQNEYKPYVYIKELDNKAFENIAINLIDGRLPENSNEIVIPEHLMTDGGVEYKIGDEISFNIGKRVVETGEELNQANPVNTNENGELLENIVDTKERTYTVVGIIERMNYNIETYSSPGYVLISYFEEDSYDTLGKRDIGVIYENPSKAYEIEEEIISVIKEKSGNTVNTTINNDLISYQGGGNNAITNSLYVVITIVIIIIIGTSIFVIRNSFNISVSEKMRQYGMLKSIGATKKQIRKTVVLEGLYLGLVSIPIGILGGILATAVLVQVVNGLIGNIISGSIFVLDVPILAIIVAVALAVVTIYLSAIIPAFSASRKPAIELIRGNDDIKINKRKIKTSKLTKKLFGIGGVIASKNLKRSKKKYRTTVISIIVSITVFITIYTFFELGLRTSEEMYGTVKYNVSINLSESEKDGSTLELIESIKKEEYTEEYSYYKEVNLEYDTNQLLDQRKYVEESNKLAHDEINQDEEYIPTIPVYIVNNEEFKRYVQSINLDPEKYDEIVILNDTALEIDETGKHTYSEVFNINDKDKMNLTINDNKYEVEIDMKTDKAPMGLEMVYSNIGGIYISEDNTEILENINEDEIKMPEYLTINSSNPDKLAENLETLSKSNELYSDIKVYNIQDDIEASQNIMLVMGIFLYGFITVITLIGVTNIFNTITTNMNLRSKEFANLKSIGMTKTEFNKMIRFESILYGAKSLLIGIPLGILGSYLIFKASSGGMDYGYELPIKAILISVICVFILITITMKYSLSKINKQNIIETIRKDNI